MKRFMVLVAVMVLLLAVSCDTLNIGTGTDVNRGPSTIVVTFPTPAVHGGDSGAITITWVGGTGAITMSADFGGGTTVNIAAGTAAGTSPYTQTFTFVNDDTVNDATYDYTVTLTDANGQEGIKIGTFPVGNMLNQLPVIDSAVFDAGVLTVTVSDPDDGETLEVTVTEPAGFVVDAVTKTAAATGPFVATFSFSATDMINGGSGDTTVTVNDGDADCETPEVVAISAPPIVVPPDTIWALAGASTATVGGAPVTITVVTGDLANEFMYCNGVGVSVEDGGVYALESFNVGAVGGGNDSDGIWGDMSPVPTAFASPQDWMMAWEAIAGDPDNLGMMAFNVAPAIGGSGVTGGGILFNFGMEFSAAGTYNVGIVYMNIVRRTFYSDSAQAPWEWTDMDNDHAFNTITVT